MLDPTLFFGFCIDDAFETGLQSANAHLVKLFIKNDSDYLHELEFENKRYCGKFLEQTSNLEQLKALEVNIYSIAKRLVSDYDFSKNRAILLTTVK